ncbi:MAG: hypothetical protein M3082_11585 [Candidatus Dormibacteraeota bacterium]|nr:hypothetical protein [Candidatus Dormibacteraeota bacterium]
MTFRVVVFALAALTLMVACRVDGTGTAGHLSTPVQSPDITTPALVDASPSPRATPTPSSTPAKPVATPGAIAVSFSGLKAGTYPVHLHSACNGSQSFHIAIEQSLVIDRGGNGKVTVTSSNFGRGLCLIVYSSPALSTVLTVRKI